MNIAQSVRVGLAINSKNKSWLADQLQVSKNFISQVCKNNRNLNQERIEEVSEIFGVKDSVFISWGEL